MKTLVVQLITALVLLSTAAHSQITLSLGSPNLHAGKIGVGIDGISGSPDLLLKYFANNQLALQLIVGVDITSLGGDALPGQVKVTGSNLRGGLSVLVHLSQDQVSPYVGAEGIFELEKEAGFYATEPDARKIVNGSLVFGAEYYFNEKICLGLKQALGAAFLLKRDVPKQSTDVKFQTSTLMTGRFYFN